MQKIFNQMMLVFLLFLMACANHSTVKDVSRKTASNEEEITISPSDLNKIFQGLPLLGRDQIGYHWTSIDNAFRWGLNKKINKAEVEFLNIFKENDKQHYGPGFYISLDPTNSNNFGDFAVNIKLNKEIRVYTVERANQILGRVLTPKEHHEIKKQLNVIDLVEPSKDWYVINNPALLESLEIQADVVAQRFMQNRNTPYYWKHLPEALLKNGKENELGQYIQSLVALIYYQDGLSFERSLRVSPLNPWQEFEPHGFEAFKNKLIMISENASNQMDHNEKDKLKLIKNGNEIGHKGLSKAEWSKLQTEQILPSLNPYTNKYRNEGIRVGGDGPNETFRASNIELLNLLSNDFIEVHYSAIPGSDFFNVYYFYPDAFHFKQLKSILSKELFEDLTNENPARLMDNHARRNELNERIIKELLNIVFKIYEGESIKGKALSLYKDLMSIHPFADGNGRTLRLYFMAMMANVGEGLPIMFWSDNDLTKGISRLKNEINSTSHIMHQFMVKYVMSALKKPAEWSMGEFNKKIRSTGILKILQADGAEDLRELTPFEEKLIKERKLFDFKDSFTNGKWRRTDISKDFIDINSTGKNTEIQNRVFILCMQNEMLSAYALDNIDYIALGNDEIEMIKKLPSHIVIPRLLKILNQSNKENSENISAFARYYLNEERIKIDSADFLPLAKKIINGDHYTLETKKAIIAQVVKLNANELTMKFLGEVLTLNNYKTYLDPLLRLIYPSMKNIILHNPYNGSLFHSQLIEIAYQMVLLSDKKCASGLKSIMQN